MKCIVTIYEIKSFKLFRSFLSRFIIKKLSIQDRWLIEKVLLFWVKWSVTTTTERENIGLVWDRLFPDIYLCFSPKFLWFCSSSSVAFGFIPTNLTNPLFGWELCVLQRDLFYPQQDYELVIFYRKSSLHIIARSVPDRKKTTFWRLAQNWNLWSKVCRIKLFSTLPTTLQSYAKMDRTTRIRLRYKLWIYRFFQEQRYEVLLIFDNSCEGICNSKAFVNIATAGRHRWFSTTYI